MGFFSWLTADTEESIANVHSGNEMRTVYLIQPEINGHRDAPIKETAYPGYGRFGGVYVYEWLAAKNFGDASLISAAINADCGNYYSDADHIYLCSLHIDEAEFRKVIKTDRKIIEFPHYEHVLSNGKTPNQLIAEGVWFSNKIELKYPLKFSFNPNAVYEDLPASKTCPFQGFFYEN